jgi:hypothetical protein
VQYIEELPEEQCSGNQEVMLIVGVLKTDNGN